MTAYDVIKFTNIARTSIVYLGSTRVKENYQNKIKFYSLPTTSTTPETTMAINLNRIEDRYTVTGNLSYGKLDATDTYTSAKDKKDGLKNLINKGADVYMTYEGTEYKVNVDKYDITDDANDNSDSTDGEVVYSVTVSCVVSEDKA